MSGIVHGCKSRKMGIPEVDSVIKRRKVWQSYMS